MELKWTIHELIKKANNENFIQAKLDLRPYLTKEFEDLIDILETEVSGEYEYFHSEEMFSFNLDIKTTLIMLCSITLREVEVALDFHSQINFSLSFIDDDTHVIEGITIDLEPYIFSEILVEKPMRVISKDAYQDYHDEVTKLTEEEIESSNPFAKLKK
jgi:uncharacterized protein